MSDLPFIVFDVNETPLDLETMAPTFERIFGDRAAMRLLFANLILYSAGAHRGRTICAVHGYRRRGDEDAGGYARHNDQGRREEGAYRKLLDDAAASGSPTPRCASFVTRASERIAVAARPRAKGLPKENRNDRRQL